ncbi:hypothetical protein Tco_0405407 [Tanacetum coccineum]
MLRIFPSPRPPMPFPSRRRRCLAIPALPSSPLPIVPHPYGSLNPCASWDRLMVYRPLWMLKPDVTRAKEVGYEIRDTWVDPREAAEEIALGWLGFARTQIFQSVEALVDDRQYHYETARLTNGHGDGSHNPGTGIRGTTHTPHECTYKDFLNCHPLNVKGTKGVVVLAQWFEKMESVFYISNYAMENQVKFATCTFIGNALTWWNSHMKAVTQDVAYAMD